MSDRSAADRPTDSPDQPEDGKPRDERELVLPADWRHRLHPRRGGGAVPEVTVDGSSAAKAAEMLDDGMAAVEAALGSPDSERAVVGALRRHLDGDPDPLGAGAVAAVLAHRHGGYGHVLGLFVDTWIREHGLTFAACALTEFAGMAAPGYRHLGMDHRAIRFVDPGHVIHGLFAARHIPRKVRALLAASDDEAYEDAVKHLADHRAMPAQQAMASYLIPTRADWVEECVAVVPTARLHFGGWLLWCSLSSPDHAEVLGTQLPLGHSEVHTDVLATIIEGVGTAIVPALAVSLDSSPLDADQRRLALRTLAMLPTDEAFQLMLDRVDRPYTEAALADAATRFPKRALRLLTSASRGVSKTSSLAADVLKAHVPAHRELAQRLLPDLPAQDRAALEAVLASTARRPEAPAEELPAVLVAPPWSTRRKAAKKLTVTGLEPPDLRSVSWAPGEREEWKADSGPSQHWRDLDEMIRDFDELRAIDQVYVVLHGPREAVLPMLQDWVPKENWYLGWRLRGFVARYGLDALPIALRLAKAGPANWGGALLPFFDRRVAALQANWLARLKSARKHAVAWFDRHGLEAAMMLVPDAVGKAGAARRNAEVALRHLATRHGDEAVVEVAGRYTAEAAEAVAALLATDPLEVLPARIPKVPAWAAPLGLPQVLLRDRERSLPPEATGHLLTMLALSTLDETYPGIDIVRETCDPASLAAFSWAVFRRWQAHGSPSKDGWALTQLGLLGDDDAVRGLAPMIRAWPGEGGHARAVQGLDVLAAIGTDVALLHLYGIAQKVRFKALRARAQERIEQVAAELRLTPEQLADRLVPDFGLDADGSMTLDYGPRRFTVGFDEELKPYVLDGDGKRRKALPKPGAKDDQELAPAAYKRFSQLKKDVRTVAADQIQRLETAMLKGRRWPLAEFQRLFVGHPLVWHIVRRLVLSAEHDGGTTFFRIAEDRTYADAGDDVIDLPEKATVGIPHPIELGEAVAAWSEIFADYEILQPFAQLGRPVHTLLESERDSGRLTRFEGITVPTGKVLGLQRRGWERGEPQDAGIEGWISREIGPGLYVSITLDPGISAGYVDMFEKQKLAAVQLRRAHGAAPDFGDLPAAMVSEILTDLTNLTAEHEGTRP
ncbi:DUF4132 domain-containing protein [Actinomadura sp. SCN-SB]|uniref:DUF4132 domain-containing protein n=1 Tax=Actinomadura sp. SCN-SB TaxID=3373092 RepID=UPI0037529AB5